MSSSSITVVISCVVEDVDHNLSDHQVHVCCVVCVCMCVVLMVFLYVRCHAVTRD